MSHVKGEHLKHLNDAQEMPKWRRSHQVTKPLLGGRTPNRMKIMDGHTAEVLAEICGLSVKEFVEVYS